MPLPVKWGRSHYKYLIDEDTTLREWCLMNGYSYQVALELAKQGKEKEEIEKQLKKLYMADTKTIYEASLIAAERWRTCRSLEEKIDIRSEFYADWGDHPYYEKMWDSIVDDAVIAKGEIWKKVAWSRSYEVSNYGRVRHRLMEGNYRILSPYKRKKERGKSTKSNTRYYMAIKIGNSEQSLAQLVALCHVPKGEGSGKKVVHIIDGNYKHVKATNLEWVSARECGRLTGYTLERSKVVERLDAEGNVIATYRSARDAAKHLYISYQTVLDYCNKKVAKPLYELRFKS